MYQIIKSQVLATLVIINKLLKAKHQHQLYGIVFMTFLIIFTIYHIKERSFNYPWLNCITNFCFVSVSFIQTILTISYFFDDSDKIKFIIMISGIVILILIIIIGYVL